MRGRDMPIVLIPNLSRQLIESFRRNITGADF